MAIIGAFAHLFVVFLLACLGIAFGTRMLKSLGLDAEGNLEEALYAAGLFFASLQVIVFLLAVFGWLNPTVLLVVLSGEALLAGKAWLQVGRVGEALISSVRRARQSPTMLFLIVLSTVCMVADAFLAMAPLTGSDAMRYHFTAPMLEVGKRWEPVFWLSQSFYTGLGHALIQVGMTLGSDRISTGLIFVAGALTTGSLFVLTRRLACERWAWIAVLTFLVTPMVYWQMSTSGSPDIWMAFYTTLAVLAAAHGVQQTQYRWLSLAGFFAGAAAGVKYTGCVIPVALIACCLGATRSWKQAARCGLWSLPASLLPLVRNSFWTRDPFFPFLTPWLTPNHVNHHLLKAFEIATHPGGFHRSPTGLLAYPLALSLNGNAYGVGHYFGPVVLAFAPLLILAVRKGFLSMASAVMWAVVLLSNDLTSQSARFLLPVFPLALALTLTGMAEASRRGWRIVVGGCYGTLVLALLFGLGSEAVYARDFLPVVVGLENREEFLQRMAPDYPLASFINRSMKGQEGKVMVFIQHTYYLKVPFLSGDPNSSWLMDPDQIAGSQALLDLLRQQDVRWIVKAPEYPAPLLRTFETLEHEGKLQPVATTEVDNYAGFRIYGQKVKVGAVILRVSPSAP
jgi:Dolichyl-phosphate-mannose-protein mannosyltransferase/Protein of unknown function (DUF1420)